jgi:hypothetical protein
MQESMNPRHGGYPARPESSSRSSAGRRQPVLHLASTPSRTSSPVNLVGYTQSLKERPSWFEEAGLGEPQNERQFVRPQPPLPHMNGQYNAHCRTNSQASSQVGSASSELGYGPHYSAAYPSSSNAPLHPRRRDSGHSEASSYMDSPLSIGSSNGHGGRRPSHGSVTSVAPSWVSATSASSGSVFPSHSNQFSLSANGSQSSQRTQEPVLGIYTGGRQDRAPSLSVDKSLAYGNPAAAKTVVVESRIPDGGPTSFYKYVSYQHLFLLVFAAYV